jgi:hypothetical protein
VSGSLVSSWVDARQSGKCMGYLPRSFNPPVPLGVQAALAAYHPHPAHVACVTAMAPIRDDVAVVDFLLPAAASPAPAKSVCCGAASGPTAHCWLGTALITALAVGATLFLAKRK